MQEGGFRQDLYYRLNVVDIHLPPLRERPEDISAPPPLRERFNADLTGETVLFRSLTCIAQLSLAGNVRELENVIERALVLCQGEEITPHYLPAHLARG